ncbi:MAG: hypothetical protein OEY36_00600 [Gammaproteobacteria bacterium]|nr:hypothetical protein [Gammaproteobacteria bacterium]
MKVKNIKFIKLFSFVIVVFFSGQALAHHVLGRPAYSLNEDSNTPPSMQVETQIGSYFVTYMVYPAFPRAGERGRVNVYASRIDDGDSYGGKMFFEVKNDVMFGDENKELLGTQSIDDGVYRQGFIFKEDGDYIITASFEADGEPYIIDFPLQVGEGSSMAPVLIALAFIVFALISVNVLQRRRLMREKIRSVRNNESQSE